MSEINKLFDVSEFQFNFIHQILYSTEFKSDLILELDTNIFSDEILRILFFKIKQYCEQYKKTPDISNLKAIIKSSDTLTDAQKELCISKLMNIFIKNNKIKNNELNNDLDFVKSSVTKFIQTRKLSNLKENKFDEIISTGNLEKIHDLQDDLRKIISIGEDEDLGVNVFDIDDDVYENKLKDPILTGIKKIDDIIGGVPKGKLGLIVAGQGVGKSSLLAYIASSAYDQGKKVLHIIFDENEVRDIQRLNMIKWSKIPSKEFKTRKAEVKKLVAQYKEKVDKKNGALIIKRFASEGFTVPKLKNKIEKLQNSYGFKFDMIVIDYVDEMESHKRNNNDIWNAQVDVMKALHSLVVELDIVGWTATQAQKTSNDKKVLEFQDCGGSVAKLKKSQLVIGIGRDATDRESGLANFSIMKCNYAKSGHIFNGARFDMETMTVDLSDTNDVFDKNLSDETLDKVIAKTEEELHQKTYQQNTPFVKRTNNSRRETIAAAV